MTVSFLIDMKKIEMGTFAFRGDYFGMLTDIFGIQWMVSFAQATA